MINIIYDELKMSCCVDPIDLYGAPYGRIFRQYIDGEAQNEFAITTGMNDRPIMIWWDDEAKEYRFTSESKKELKAFRKGVKYKYLPYARLDSILRT